MTNPRPSLEEGSSARGARPHRRGHLLSATAAVLAAVALSACSVGESESSATGKATLIETGVSAGCVAAGLPPGPPARRLLVFERGDPQRPAIWVAEPDGSRERRLAGGRLPDLSPDGRLVAFSRDGDLWVAPSEGGPARLLASSAVSYTWSPGSRALLAHLLSERKLVLLDATSGRRTVIDPKVDALLGASFSPDGCQIVWARELPGARSESDLFIVPAAGGPARRLTFGGRAFAPLWTYLGIVYSERGKRQHIVRLDRHWLIQPDSSRRKAMPCRYCALVDAATGSSTLLARAVNDVANYDGRPILLDLATGAARAPDAPEFARAVAISNDGKWVLITQPSLVERQPVLGTSDVARIPATGGQPEVLVRDAANPDWNL